MKKLFNASLLPLLFAFTFSANASTHNEVSDDSKYCFYADKEYSIGAQLLQEGVRLVCVKGDNGKTRWVEA